MKEYFYAFLLGIASPVVSHLLVGIVWYACGKPRWIPIGDIMFWTLTFLLGTLFFYKVYCPRKGIRLAADQKFWAGMWYVIAVAIVFRTYWLVMFMLYH